MSSLTKLYLNSVVLGTRATYSRSLMMMKKRKKHKLLLKTWRSVLARNLPQENRTNATSAEKISAVATQRKRQRKGPRKMSHF
jgi:hypothetical protein